MQMDSHGLSGVHSCKEFVVMLMIAFWDIAPCSLIGVMMEAVRTSETLVYFSETTWRYIPGGCNLHTCYQKKLKSLAVMQFYRTSSKASLKLM
jgi:hypothetical protein